MGKIDSGSKSNRLLASRRYTHNTYTTAQESFTNVLDLRSEEIYTQAHHITASNLPYSGSSQHGSTLSVGGNEIKKYWYRHKLTPSNVNNEVWLFLSPTGSDDGVGAQLVNDNQQTNFISPKYAVSALANATTEDSTPGYLAAVFKSSAVSQSAQTGSLSSGDLVSTNDYQFDYKTGVVQFLNANVDPTDSQYVYMTVYQYVGKTLKTGLEVEGNISGSAISTGSFGHFNATEFSSDTATLISGSTNPAAVSGSWQGVVGSGSLGMVSGSAISTGSFGRLELSSSLSASATSTGSFGAVYVGGMTNSNLLDVSSSVSTRTTTLENANISGGFVAQTVLSGSGTLISGSSLSTGSFGSLRVTSPQTLTIDNTGTVSGSSTSTGSFGRVIIAEMGNSDLTVVSSSISTRTTTLETTSSALAGTGTVQGVGTGNAVTFATVDTGQGANELYDMDQNVKTDSNVTFANVTATGIVTAEEFHTEFVSASIVYVSGSTKFGDTSDDIHSFTGSVHLVNSGSVSGSIFSTGSFGAVYAGGMSVPNLINVSSSFSTRVTSEEGNVDSLQTDSGSFSTRVGLLEGSGSITESSASFSTRATTLENANISGGFVAQTVLSGSGTLISGSVLSTGSFGRVIIAEMGNSDLTVVSSSISTRTTTLENANISGGFVAQTVLSGSGTLISGSVLSTGSFGSLRVTSPQTLTIDNTGTVSGSATSTGSFGSISVATSASLDSLITSKADINGGTIDGTTIGAASHTTIKGTTIDATTDFTIDGLVLTADTITNDATLTIDGAADMVIDVDGGNLDIKDDGVALLNISATKVSGSAISTGSFGSLRVTSPQTLTIDNTGTVSGSATSTGSFGYLHIGGDVTASGVIKADAFESVTGGDTISFSDSLNITGDITASGHVSGSSTSTGSFGAIDVTGMSVSNLIDVSSSFSTRVTTEEGNVDDLQTDSGSFSTRVGLLEGSGSITESSASFSTRVTDLNLYLSGSGKLISGSAISTGSFGSISVATSASLDSLVTSKADINGGTIDGTTIGAASHTTIKGTTIDATTDFTIDGLVITADTITNDATLTIDGAADMVIDVDGGNLDVKDDGVALLNISATNVSGSATSTGSFGHLNIAGNITASGTVRADAFESVTGGDTIDFNDSLDVTGDITASGNFTGSAISTETGSFGRVESSLITGTLVTAAQTNVTSVGTIGTGVWDSSFGSTANTTISGSFTDASSSFSSRVNLLEGSGSITESSASFSTRVTTEEGNVDDLQTDSGSFSTRVGLLEGSGSITESSASFSTRVTTEEGNVDDLQTDSGSFSTRVALLEGSGSITESSASFSTRVTTEEGNVDDLQTDSGSFSTRVALLEGSGSITESSASFSTRITSEEGNVDALQTDSGSFSTRVTTTEASGALFDGTGAVTFATVDTGQGANELYDMDQNVKTDSNVTFGNITATGTVTAEEFHTEFVSASIVYASGSTKFGDTSDDIHSFTGSIHLTNSGSVSGSSTSTASFGRVEASTVKGTLATAAQTNITSVGTIATGVWDSSFGSTANTTISGSWQGVIGSGSLGMVSGSAISTGSFGAVNIAGMTVPNLLDFSSSIASRVTSEESDFTAAGISGSWQGVIGSGSLGMVSGSAISTGSFASLRVTSPQTLTIDNKGTVSGSIYSTGSFGKLIGEGGALSNVTAVPFLKTGSYYSATTDVKITGSLAVSGNISGSYSGLSVGQKYLHAQSSAATTWTISHNFDYQFVNVDVYDSNDQIVIPTSITATDTNTITLTFGSAISGNAIVSTGGQARDELGKNKQHIQDTAATNWRVTHSVGEQYPSVTVYDEEDNVIQPQQIYAASAQRMDIVFAQPQSGNANFSVGGGISLSSITSSVQLSGVNFGDISGSVTSTGSFGALRVVGPTLKVDNVGTVSGSATSTGSFGAVSVAGMTVSNLLDFSSSIASRVTTEESDFTAAGISGSWQGVVGSGSLGMVSGSAISTGSFGYVNVAGMTTPSILALSSSIETRLNSLSADIIALSIALG